MHCILFWPVRALVGCHTIHEWHVQPQSTMPCMLGPSLTKFGGTSPAWS